MAEANGAPVTPEALRERLCLALDSSSPDAALELARSLAEQFAVAKVGLELFSAAGPSVVGALAAVGFEVFVDLKLHDIPTTVARAAGVLGGLGARYVTMHCAGGEAMLAAGVEGLSAGADRAGLPAPGALGVTVLTSDPAAAPELLEDRVRLAARAGCVGFVCAAPDLSVLDGFEPGLLRVVPGTRPPSADRHDQARSASPAAALGAGAGLLVIGRVVTAASDPRAAAATLCASLASPA